MQTGVPESWQGATPEATGSIAGGRPEDRSPVPFTPEERAWVIDSVYSSQVAAGVPVTREQVAARLAESEPRYVNLVHRGGPGEPGRRSPVVVDEDHRVIEGADWEPDAGEPYYHPGRAVPGRLVFTDGRTEAAVLLGVTYQD